MEEMESIDSNSDIELMDEDPDPVNISIKRKHPIHGYFVYSSESQTSRCVFKGCATKLKGKNPTNLVAHLKAKHRKEHEEYSKLKKAYDVGFKKPKVSDKKARTSASHQPSLKSVSIIVYILSVIFVLMPSVHLCF